MLGQLSNTLYQNRAESSAKVEIEVYERFVRQVVTDLHTADEFLGLEIDGSGNLRSRLKGLVEERLEKIANKYTHYFPAWTLGMERKYPFSLSLVRIMNKADWIDTVDFRQLTNNMLFGCSLAFAKKSLTNRCCRAIFSQSAALGQSKHATKGFSK